MSKRPRITLNRSRQRGMTLVELVAFIVIIGVVVAGITAGLSGTVRSTGLPREMNTALQLAQERMELIRGQKDIVGFGAFTAANYDPCLAGSTHPACNTPPLTGYTVTPCFYTGAGVCGTKPPCFGGDTNYKCVTLSVTGPEGTQLAELTTMVANY